MSISFQSPSILGFRQELNTKFYLTFISMGVFIVLSSVNGGTVFAQKKSEIDRRAKVEVAQVETKIMSSFEEIPGRIVITSKEAVTASINGAIEIEKKSVIQLWS